jgi:hypothetical protein
MKRCSISLICTLLVLAAGLVHAQEQCGTGSKMIPSSSAGVADLQRIRDNIADLSFAKQQGDTLIFPVVVHVIHNGGVGNIPDSQIVDGLRIVNEDFNRENADTSVTRNLFKPYAAAVGFKFMLAKLDSNGDSTSGIVRIDTSIIPHPEPTSPDFDNCKRLSAWPPDMYYNIWIVRSIQSGTLGYAQYPGTNFTYGGPWETWGIVVRHDQWGTIGTSSADGRTGTHEVGHTFGLYHTFLSSSAGCGSVCDTTGDEVCDTPPNKYSGACSQLANTCTNDTSGNSVYDTNVVDQIENYMSYNTCQNMLSEGQKTRMRGFIAEFSILQGLSSDSNLFATGLIDTIPLDIKDEVRDGFVISVSPNPFYDEITLLVPKDLNTDRNNIRLINLLGQEMNYSIQYNYMIRNEQSVTLQVPSDLKSGLYFLKVGRNIAKVVKE